MSDGTCNREPLGENNFPSRYTTFGRIRYCIIVEDNLIDTTLPLDVKKTVTNVVSLIVAKERCSEVAIMLSVDAFAKVVLDAAVVDSTLYYPED